MHTTSTHTTVDQHAALIRSLVRLPVRPEIVPLDEALGRRTFGAVTSPVDLPLFRNSQMDGFAVRAADVPGRLPIVGEIAAAPGTPAALQPGTAVRIMTGAVVPDGADAVVPVEDTAVDGSTVTITRGRAVGEFVRERGDDVRTGTVLLHAGTVLGSRHLAVLAAAGIERVEVRSRPRVVVVTTGAELVGVGETPGPGQIHDANAVALVAAVRACGATVTAFRVRDDTAALRDILTGAAPEADLIVTSGGISMGEYEVVRELLEPLGGAIGHIAMQPGGPQATAVVAGVPVLGFPGNPVSTQISFEVFLAPILREAAGLPAAERGRHTLSAGVRSVPGKRQFLRGRLREGGVVEVVAGPGSHLVAGLAASDVLIDVPEATTELVAGDEVETWKL